MSGTRPRLRLRIEFDGEHTLGPGKMRLLAAVDELGSISAAARSMGMSYRHAWEMLDDINQCFGGRAFEAGAGGRAGGGARVTDFGLDLIARYHAMLDKATKATASDLKALERARKRLASHMLAPARYSATTSCVYT